MYVVIKSIGKSHARHSCIIFKRTIYNCIYCDITPFKFETALKYGMYA